MPRATNLALKVESPVIEPALHRPRLAIIGESTDPLDELFHRKPLRQHVREFGQVMALVGLLLSLYITWTHGSLANAGAITIASGLIVFLCSYATRLMLPVWQGWMKLGGLLEITTTWTILGLMWAAMFIPLSIALRIFKIAVMDMTYKTDAPTYWLDTPVEKTDFMRLERQF